MSHTLINNFNYYIMILFKQFYWLSCCHLTFRKIWYCLIKTRIDSVSLLFSNEIYKKNHVNSISIWPMDIKVMQTSRNLLRSCQSFRLTDMKILSDRKIFCRSEKKKPQKIHCHVHNVLFGLFRVFYPSISNWAPDFTSGFYRG